MFHIGDSDIHGKGIIADRRIKYGERIGKWIASEPDTNYRYLDRRFGEWYETYPLGRFCNHSSDPNTGYEFIEGDVYLISLGIEEGEEIVVDYEWAYVITGFESEILK